MHKVAEEEKRCARLQMFLTRTRSTVLPFRSFPSVSFNRSFRLYPRNMDIIIDSESSKLHVTSHRQYDGPDTISPTTVSPDPLTQFRTWFTEAKFSPLVPEPEAMSLSTSTASGTPSSRFVLLKQVDPTGFVFFTNYASRKSREIEQNPRAALAFYWGGMHRQVRVVGRVEKVTKEESWEYFKGRPIGSRLGAWASPQSEVVGEGEMSDRLKEVHGRFGYVENGDGEKTEAEVPLPEFWGGWRVVPEYVITSF